MHTALGWEWIFLAKNTVVAESSENLNDATQAEFRHVTSFISCFFMVFGHNRLQWSRTVRFCETTQKVTRSSMDTVVSRKQVKFQFRVHCPFKRRRGKKKIPLRGNFTSH